MDQACKDSKVEGLPVPRNELCEHWRRREKLTRAFRNSPDGATGREGFHGVDFERGMMEEKE